MSTVLISASDDDVPAFGEEEVPPPSRVASLCCFCCGGDRVRLRRPCVTLSHVIFGAGALLVYILCERLSLSFVSTFVAVTLLLAADFWTVKNISGRLLVGLRWWNHVDASSGRTRWLFECRQKAAAHVLSAERCTAAERRVFWTALVLAPALWFLLLIMSFIGFRYAYMMLPVLGVTLSGANLYGYLRCRYGNWGARDGGLQDRLSQWSSGLLRRQLMSNMMTMFSRKTDSSESALRTQTVI